MSTRPMLLDLFCGAGGAAMGYHRAGFEVIGIDLQPQPRYPFRFVRGDALKALEQLARRGSIKVRQEDGSFVELCGFAALHASPPCQAHVTMSNRWRGAGGRADSHRSLIADTRDGILQTGLPYILENVVGARCHLLDPVRCCGSAFSLGVERHRLFESSVPLHGTGCAHRPDTIGVYGKAHDGRLLWRRRDGSEQRAARTLTEARVAMGIGWMQWRELAEAIPPAYTEFLGKQLLQHLQHEAVA